MKDKLNCWLKKACVWTVTPFSKWSFWLSILFFGYFVSLMPSDLVSYGWLALISGVSDLSIDVKKYVSEPEKRVASWASKEYLDASTQEMVKAVKHELKDHWKCF